MVMLTSNKQTFICSNTKYKQVRIDGKKVTCPQVAWMPPMPLFKFQENVWHLHTKNIEIAKRENKQAIRVIEHIYIVMSNDWTSNIGYFFPQKINNIYIKNFLSTIIDSRRLKLATTWITGIQKPLPLVRGTLWTMKGNVDHTSSLKDRSQPLPIANA
jgi:hypothetical protein